MDRSVTKGRRSPARGPTATATRSCLEYSLVGPFSGWCMPHAGHGPAGPRRSKDRAMPPGSLADGRTALGQRPPLLRPSTASRAPVGGAAVSGSRWGPPASAAQTTPSRCLQSSEGTRRLPQVPPSGQNGALGFCGERGGPGSCGRLGQGASCLQEAGSTDRQPGHHAPEPWSLGVLNCEMGDHPAAVLVRDEAPVKRAQHGAISFYSWHLWFSQRREGGRERNL